MIEGGGADPLFSEQSERRPCRRASREPTLVSGWEADASRNIPEPWAMQAPTLGRLAEHARQARHARRPCRRVEEAVAMWARVARFEGDQAHPEPTLTKLTHRVRQAECSG